MKYISALIGLLLLITILPPLYSEDDDSLLKDIEYLDNFYPCRENSDNEKEVYKFIRKRLDSLDINYYEETLDRMTDSHSFSSNIIADFDGNKEQTLLIAVPVNNLKNSSYNVAKALSFAEHLKNAKKGINYKILFLGAEYSNDNETEYPIGSTQFLNTYFPETDSALLYLDISSLDSEIDIIHGGLQEVTPVWLLKEVLDSLEKGGVHFRINTQQNILYQLGYDTPTPVDIYLENNIPAVSLLSRGGNAVKLNRTDSIERLNNFFSDFTQNINVRTRVEWDRHYFMINSGGSIIVISELSFIIIYIVLIGSLILFSVISSKKVFRYAKKLFRYFWVLIYFFLLIFVFLLIATFLTALLTEIKSSYDIWKVSPFFLLFIKIVISMLLFFLSLFLLKKVKLPVSGSFYSASAIFLFLVVLVIFQLLNISLSLFSLWGLFWTIMFSLFKSRIVKTICMFLSSVFIIYIVYYVFSRPAYNLCERILFDKLTGNILISLVILPYIMMILRILITQTHIESFKYLALRRSIYSGTALIFIFLLNYYMKNNPYPADNPQPVYFTQTADMNRMRTAINIKTPYKTGRISFFSGEREYTVETSKTEYKQAFNTELPFLRIEKESSSFLDRKNLVMKIYAEGNPEKYLIDFYTKNSPVILDSNYPFTLYSSEKKGTLHIGKNPPNPLVLDILVPENTSLWFEIKSVSDEFPFDNKLTGENKVFNQRFEVIKGTDG